MDSATNAEKLRVCVVGSGTRFLSGISYYTFYLVDTLSERFEVSAVLMRRLVPRWLYPGRARVGSPITPLSVSALAPTYDGIDWYLIPSLIRAGRFLKRQHTNVVVFQWWTGTAVLSYLYLTRIARRGGARVVVEFHEEQDTGEAALPLVGRATRAALQQLIARADGFVTHSQWDRNLLCERFSIDPDRVYVILHGPYPMANPEHLGVPSAANPVAHPDLRPPTITREVEDSHTKTILFFGTIRPFKGVEDLVEAFEHLPRDDEHRWRLLVVGETWQGWTLPAERIASSSRSSEIEFINRYVTDSEVVDIFARADIVALPYHRSSASGPLHLSMQRGLPVVVTKVGGLVEAAESYGGTVFADPRDPISLRESLVLARELCGTVFSDVHSWTTTLDQFQSLFDMLRLTPSPRSNLDSQ